MVRLGLPARHSSLSCRHTAEDWYKNDYPDEEDDRSDDGGSEGSDVFHEHSDYDDVVHEPRGRWSLEDDDDKDF